MLGARDFDRSLAASGAVLVTFIGLAHEIVGEVLFPTGPAMFGSPMLWHGLGVAGVVTGVLLLAGTLHVLAVPVVPMAVLVGVMGAVITVATAALLGQFHFFAFSLVVAAALVAICHQRAEREAGL
jgi:hypothetical protein